MVFKNGIKNAAYNGARKIYNLHESRSYFSKKAYYFYLRSNLLEKVLMIVVEATAKAWPRCATSCRPTPATSSTS